MLAKAVHLAPYGAIQLDSRSVLTKIGGMLRLGISCEALQTRGLGRLNN